MVLWGRGFGGEPALFSTINAQSLIAKIGKIIKVSVIKQVYFWCSRTAIFY